MANVKNLKRDINFITSELIIECLTFDYLLPENNKSELSALITDALKFRKEMIDEVNNVKTAEVSTRGVKYRTIRSTVTKQVTEFVERMEKLNK